MSDQVNVEGSHSRLLTIAVFGSFCITGLVIYVEAISMALFLLLLLYLIFTKAESLMDKCLSVVFVIIYSLLIINAPGLVR